MPIITQVGQRSFKVRALYAIIFAVLIVGAVTMIYPLLLMLSGSVKSESDIRRITPLPAYLFDDDALWMKYVESKYGSIGVVEAAYQREIGSWARLRPPTSASDEPWLGDYLEFRERGDWPSYWYTLGHARYVDLLAKNAREYRAELQERFDGSIEAYSRAVGLRYHNWAQVGPPLIDLTSRRFVFRSTVNLQVYQDVKRRVPVADRIVTNVDGQFVHAFWRPRQSRATSSAPAAPDFLPTRAPPAGAPVDESLVTRQDWELFVRDQLNIAFIRVDEACQPRWHAFLRDRYGGNIERLNGAWGSAHAAFDDIGLPLVPAETSVSAQGDFAAFVRDRQRVPAEALSVIGPRQAFEAFVLNQRGPGKTLAPSPPVRLPIEAADFHDFQRQKSALRWEFLTRNYRAVMEYLLLHGNGIRNTVIFCTLVVATQLLVNPLAAYALSRYRPPSTYAILLFCMCTMAFPAEVTMIPSFLLLKRFPLYSLLVGFVVTLGVLLLIRRGGGAWPDWFKGVLAVGIGIAVGWGVAPWIASRLFGDNGATTVSLLNTFWAIVLPGVANGFSIFLLKGFFDSLPRELYEAADIDGASEWSKFWVITMSLSKPILAVLALGAFTAAYSEFMMALVVIPDQNMWTIMVWLFQMQSSAHPSVVYASLVVAAIPTFAMFLLCQNLIMRGIVVPVEK